MGIPILVEQHIYAAPSCSGLLDPGFKGLTPNMSYNPIKKLAAVFRDITCCSKNYGEHKRLLKIYKLNQNRFLFEKVEIVSADDLAHTDWLLSETAPRYCLSLSITPQSVSRWISVRLRYLRCDSNRATCTADLHWAFDLVATLAMWQNISIILLPKKFCSHETNIVEEAITSTLVEFTLFTTHTRQPYMMWPGAPFTNMV